MGRASPFTRLLYLFLPFRLFGAILAPTFLLFACFCAALGFALLPQDFLLLTATPPTRVCVYIPSYESIGMNYVHLAAL